jgi:hypothetical protein
MRRIAGRFVKSKAVSVACGLAWERERWTRVSSNCVAADWFVKLRNKTLFNQTM